MPVKFDVEFFSALCEVIKLRREGAKEQDAVEYTYWSGAVDAIQEIIEMMTEQESGALPC